MLLELVLVFLAILLIWIILSYRSWKRNLLRALNENSEVATTSRGEIEYVLKGSGPVILFLHGSPGGYDQGTVDMEMWTDAGFSLLSISRPGYLRTPLSTGETFEEQADAIEALLETLEISKVAIIGASGGGSKTKTIKDAIKHNAFIKVRPVNSRSGPKAYFDPYIKEI